MKTKNIYVKRSVRFDDGKKFTTRSPLRLDIQELAEDQEGMIDLLEDAKKSGKEAGKRVTSTKIQAVYVKT